MVRAAGFEPAETAHITNELADANAPENSLVFQDSELTGVVHAWDGLPQALRLALLAIVRSHQRCG
jgi:hypothetical protein